MMAGRLLWTLLALGGIWAAVTLVSLFSPDLVSGSEQGHIPIAAMFTWFWGVMATISVLNEMMRQSSSLKVWMGISISTLIIWLSVTLVSLLGPVMITGSDPTQIPIAAILAPIGGALVTSVICAFMQLLVNK